MKNETVGRGDCVISSSQKGNGEYRYYTTDSGHTCGTTTGYKINGCSGNGSYNNSYADTTITASDGTSYKYGTVFTEKTTKSEGIACSSYANCYIGCSCNTSNGWYSSCQGSDCKSATDNHYTGVNSLSAGKSISDVASISASGANSGISAMAAGATTCYKKKTCSEGGYFDSEPAGQACTSVNYNGLTCYKDCQDKCGDGNAYYTISLENNPYGSSWDPIVNLNWDSKKSDPCVIDGTKGSMEAKFEIWCPTDCTGPSLQSGDATVDIDITHPGDYTIPSNGNAWCPSGTSSPDILWNGCIINAGSCNPMNQDCKSVTRVNNTNWVAETTQGAKFHYTLTTKPVYYDCNGTLNGTWVEWDNSDNPEMLYHCCCPTRLDKYDSSCCTLDSECPDGYYEDEPNSNYFEYKTSANGNCYKVTGCAAGYTPVSTSSGYTSITTSGTTYDYHGFKCYEQSCPDGYFEGSKPQNPDAFIYEAISVNGNLSCYQITGCNEDNGYTKTPNGSTSIVFDAKSGEFCYENNDQPPVDWYIQVTRFRKNTGATAAQCCMSTNCYNSGAHPSVPNGVVIRGIAGNMSHSVRDYCNVGGSTESCIDVGYMPSDQECGPIDNDDLRVEINGTMYKQDDIILILTMGL